MSDKPPGGVDTPDPAAVTTAAPDAATAETPLLRNGNFQALWTSEAFAALAKEAAEVAYPLLILTTTGSAFYAGAVGSAQLLTASVMSIPGGTLADRVDRRMILIVCNLVRVVLLGLFALLIWTEDTNPFIIFGIAVGSAVCLGVSNPTGLAVIKQLVPPSQLTQATAQNQVRYFAATMGGPPLGGSLFAVGRAFPFLSSAVAFLVSTVLLLFIRKPLKVENAAPGEKRHAVEGFKFLARQPVLRLLIIWIMGSNMAFTHTGVFLALIATAESRGASPAFTGMLLSIAGVGGLVGSLLAGPIIKRVRPPVLFLTAAWIGPVAAVLLANVSGLIPLGIIVACVFLRGPVTSALFLAYLAAMAPDKVQGRVLGAVMFMSMIAAPIGVFAVGTIFDLAGATWVFTTMAIVSALAALPTLSPVIRKLAPPEHYADAGAAPDAHPTPKET
ncbi:MULTISPECIES: MFS transporter [Streptomyces]|uniref:MFS transporter n=1 Tax=Streptomyces glycanivorans TaxID=3033808 RepID=A0ABY9JD69_9ACTN|nr:MULTISPECIES: MFS transporter [unclassified Streptomyces]TXS17362.1 MFS transporter [Streptomyces sp. wa22]WLQ65722.1 MFS transporter [Streptomyces sp. Alt3]WSQ86507.1 MFS transporter [Streptomyces sp. NBC_01212]WSR07443.1 MFS transporter [Streptomyces sp. NBC_01208]WSR49803.1 MFS transporter [Streptomyces sp. NBC_01201]